MTKRKTVRAPLRDPEAIFAAKAARPIPFEFFLEELASLDPETRPMFGSLAVYVGEKIVGVLAGKESLGGDRGVWIATSHEHHASLGAELESMRSIAVLGRDPTGWQVLPADALSFEDDALRAAALIRAGDPRIGKVPARRRRAKRSSPRARKRSRSRGSRSRTPRRACR